MSSELVILVSAEIKSNFLRLVATVILSAIFDVSYFLIANSAASGVFSGSGVGSFSAVGSYEGSSVSSTLAS